MTHTTDKAMREALWVAVEHNALHFGENHNTVIQGRAALASSAAAPDGPPTDEERAFVARGMARLQRGEKAIAEGKCWKAPAGWHCTRAPFHEGPCAAVADPRPSAPLSEPTAEGVTWDGSEIPDMAYTEQQIADACHTVGVKDMQCQCLLIALQEARPAAPKEERKLPDLPRAVLRNDTLFTGATVRRLLTEYALAALSSPASSAGMDAQRWQMVLQKVGGSRWPSGQQGFDLARLAPVAGADLMRGSVAEHFTKAIDAAIASKEQP